MNDDLSTPAGFLAALSKQGFVAFEIVNDDPAQIESLAQLIRAANEGSRGLISIFSDGPKRVVFVLSNLVAKVDSGVQNPEQSV